MKRQLTLATVAGLVALIIATSALAGTSALALGSSLRGQALADDRYPGTNPNYRTRIEVYNANRSTVSGVRIGRQYDFWLLAFATDVSHGYMCIKVSYSGLWTCKSTIAAGTIEAGLWGTGTLFRITPKMNLGGTVTVRALDILKRPLVTRALKVVTEPATFKLTGRIGQTDAGQRAIVLRVAANGHGRAVDRHDYRICWRTAASVRCADAVGDNVEARSSGYDLAIPVSNRNVVNQRFVAWVTYKGKRVATHSMRIATPKPSFAITGQLGTVNAQQTVTLHVTAKQGTEPLSKYALCWRKVSGSRCTNPIKAFGTYLVDEGAFWSNYEIPITSNNTINGRFSAWVVFEGRRVASYAHVV